MEAFYKRCREQFRTYGRWVFGSVWQCVAMCCSLLHCVAICCSVLQCVAVRTYGRWVLANWRITCAWHTHTHTHKCPHIPRAIGRQHHSTHASYRRTHTPTPHTYIHTQNAHMLHRRNRAHTSNHKHTDTDAQTHTYTYTHTHTHTRKHPPTHTSTHRPTHKHIRILSVTSPPQQYSIPVRSYHFPSPHHSLWLSVSVPSM